MVTMPAPVRRAASAAIRAAPVIAGPPSTVTWPRAYLWASVAGVGRRHSAGVLAKVFGRTSSSAADGSPISASTSAPHRSRPGSSRWPGLQAEERHAQRRLRRIAAHLPRRAVQSARHIHRHNASRCAQRVGDHARHIASQAGAEHRVDYQRRACRRLGREIAGRAMPPCGGASCIRTVPRRRKRGDRNRPALLRQQPRRDVAVTAVVAGTAQHQRAAGRVPALHRARHRSAGIRHQHRTRHAAGVARRHPPVPSPAVSAVRERWCTEQSSSAAHGCGGWRSVRRAERHAQARTRCRWA